MQFLYPSEEYFDEYLAACQESIDNYITEWMPLQPGEFESWRSSALRTFEMLETGNGLPAGIPRMITYWCIENGKFIGELQIRPWNTEEESKNYGHFGYAVRYSQWGKGYGTIILRTAVAMLKERGISPIYNACHIDNAGSNRVSIKCGFKLLKSTETENLYILE